MKIYRPRNGVCVHGWFFAFRAIQRSGALRYVIGLTNKGETNDATGKQSEIYIETETKTRAHRIGLRETGDKQKRSRASGLGDREQIRQRRQEERRRTGQKEQQSERAQRREKRRQEVAVDVTQRKVQVNDARAGGSGARTRSGVRPGNRAGERRSDGKKPGRTNLGRGGGSAAAQGSNSRSRTKSKSKRGNP